MPAFTCVPGDPSLVRQGVWFGLVGGCRNGLTGCRLGTMATAFVGLPLTGAVDSAVWVMIANCTRYAASKHAVEAYTDTLRLEMAPFGVRCVTVNPGAFGTAGEHR